MTVLVAGAGPVGMALALRLASLGQASVLLEEDAGTAREGSRSICLQRATLEAFERVGCGAGVAAEGRSWSVARTFFRDAELLRTHLDADPREVFPPFVNLPQARVEELLHDRVRAEPRVDARFGHRVVGLEQDDERVVLAVEGPEGAYALPGAYAVGCDGGGSRVRDLLGLDFPGTSHVDRFLIADVRADLPFPEERRLFFDPSFNPGRQVLLHPQPGGVWRIDWQVADDVDLDEERASGRLDERVRAVIGDVPYELVWVSSYRFHQRRAPRLRVGRAFLAGDAAHVMAPFGARGLNSGVQDADNLAWKLAFVLAGRAPARLLDSYDPERGEAADENLRVTGATMRWMAPPGRARRALRDAVLRGSVRSSLLRRRVDGGRLSEPHTYLASPVVARDGAPRRGPQLGALAPDAPLRRPGGGGETRVRALARDGLLALHVSRDPADAQAFAARVGGVRLAAPTTVVAALPPRGRAAPVPAPVRVLEDPTGALHEAYGGGGHLWLIRPDGHVAAARADVDAARLAALVQQAVGGHPPPVAPRPQTTTNEERDALPDAR
jgi:2-polyprenyl-6-methoxyphenol hydroxylase-like FAD-dependent oxidoreductase